LLGRKTASEIDAAFRTSRSNRRTSAESPKSRALPVENGRFRGAVLYPFTQAKLRFNVRLIST
jgi:hypothetical protein